MCRFVFHRHVTLVSVSVYHKLEVESSVRLKRRAQVNVCICVYWKPRDDFSCGLHFYFLLPVNVFFIVSTHVHS